MVKSLVGGSDPPPPPPTVIWRITILLLFTHFHDFWSQIGVVILVMPKQEVERKSEWFCGVKFFHSKFKVEWENGVWTKIRFLASGFLFRCGNFALIFSVFSIFWIGFFPNPFTVLSRSSFPFSQWKFFELCVRTCPAMFYTFYWISVWSDYNFFIFFGIFAIYHIVWWED